MKDFITAIGLLLVLEGLSYAAFPKGMRDALNHVFKMPDSLLRRYGLIAAAIGLILVYICRAG